MACNQNCNQGRECKCGQRHPNADALNEYARGRKLQYSWNGGAWTNWGPANMYSPMETDPLVRWRVKPPHVKPFKDTYLTVRHGYTGQQTDAKFASDTLRLCWSWDDEINKYVLSRAEVLK